MERSLLRSFLYLVLVVGLLGAVGQIASHRSPREDPTAAVVCVVIAAAGLAASARDDRPPA